MKKFKKVNKKIPKKLVAIVLVLAIVLNYIIPLTKVFADGEYVLTFTIGNNNQEDHVMVNDGGHLKIDDQYVDLRNGDDTIGIVNCTNETTCTITVTDGQAGKLNFNSAGKFTLYMQGHPINLDFNFSANENIAIQDYVAPQEPGNDPGNGSGTDERFDGRAVVLWSCGNGVCYHTFGLDEHGDPEIGDFDDGNSTFFKDTDIEADNKAGAKFNIDAQYKGWYLTDEFNSWIEDYELATGHAIDWNTLDPEVILGEPNQNVGQYEAGAIASGCERPNEHAHWSEWSVFEACVNHYAATQGDIWTRKLKPVGEPEENNAYVSYGDRNFKVVIYNANYKGITTGDLTGLNYYPSSWADPFLRTDQYDVSNTNEVKPTFLNSILLESTVNIDVLPYNNYELESIEALDVPDGAVTINKVNSRKFQIVFSSNFYDHVVFRLNDTNGGKSYVQIKRATIDAWIRDGNTLSADFYFDKERSYEEFELTAKIIYNDGRVENVTLEAVEGFRDGLGNPVDGFEFKEYEAGGKGLKRSVFEYYIAEGADRTVKDVYLNAEYKGSNSSVYAGAYAGSGEGTPANLYHPEEVNQ